MSDLAELTRRVEALERLQFPSRTVRGWNAAARILELSPPTVVRLFRADRKFPKPTRVSLRGKGASPEWPLSSLLSYKNQNK